ncbi:flavodoxin family protein [Methanocrinis sp.]|uniref:flavodoxin family protein n=1 Tax=Methanocrinis sp. TaxID=3101522 RepID=UPI003D0E1DF8
MKIVGICGSPREKATDHVLKECLNMLEERGFTTAFFGVRGKRISPCLHCDFCLKNKECRIKDDMYEVYPLLREADGIVFATPIYNSALSAQTKAVMDRCRALAAADFDVFRGKIGMAIAVGGDRMGGQELAISQIIAFYVLNGVVPVGGGPFGANLGATFWSKDTLEGVMEDEEGLRTLRKTVRRFSDQLKGLQPEKEK